MKTESEFNQTAAAGTFLRMACNYRICRGIADSGGIEELPLTEDGTR